MPTFFVTRDGLAEPVQLLDAAAARTSLGLGTGDSPTFAGLTGTTTNDNAAAGNIGEVISSSIPSGSAVALTTGTSANVTSISLTAGDWDVYGAVGFVAAATTSVTREFESISVVSATVNTTPTRFVSRLHAAIVPGASSVVLTMGAMATRLSLAATTTVYLVAQGVFTVSTLSAYGDIWARRAR